MSTKTTFKRIALVAVAALGLGTLSSYAPATAAVNGATNTVAYASTTVDLGKDAVLVLFQQWISTGAAGADTETVTFTVTGNAFTSTTVNAATPTVFRGSDTGTVSLGVAASAETLRGYGKDAVYDGFPAADITAGAVNRNNTQTITNNSTGVITLTNVNSVSGASALTTVRGFQRVQWKPTVAGAYQLTVTTGVAANTYIWNFTVVDPAVTAAATATATAAAAVAAAKAAGISTSYSSTTLGYGFANSASAEGGTWYARTVAGTADDVYVPNSVSAGTANFFGTGLEGAGSLVTVNSAISSGSTATALPGVTLWAEINSGPGILQIRNGLDAGVDGGGTVYSQGRNIAGTLPATENIGKVLIFSDGKAGVANYSIYASVTATGAKTRLATYEVTFFDTPTKITPTALVNAIRGDIGVGSTVAASLAVRDQNGYFVPGPWLAANGYVAKVTSADTTILKSIATGAAFAKRPTKDLVNTVSLTPMGGKFGAVALSAVFTNDTGGFTAATGFSNAGKTLVANTSAAAAWSTVVSSNVAASMTVTADKQAYETGSIVTLSFKGLDVNGLILPDSCEYGITSTSDISVAAFNTANIVALPSTNLGTSVKFGGLGAACVGNDTVATGSVWPYASATPGEATLKFYAPLVVGPFNVTVKRAATNYSATIGSTSTVLALASQNAAALAQEAAMAALRAELAAANAATKAAIEAAQDAAAEAIDAGNNAYDSANAATDAADAATAAAQQAGEDAVAAAEAAGAAAVEAAQSAQDAAAEATDAATAATDAANAAAEAADAATAAAQDAADAVAALSVSVSAMVSDLKKQITALTNLVIKIQKKVKA